MRNTRTRADDPIDPFHRQRYYMYYTAGSISRGVKYLIIVTVAMYIVQIIPSIGWFVTAHAGLVPADAFMRGRIWQFGTYLFLHGSPFHLAFNMLALWMFGVELEQMWGTRRFLFFYGIAGIGSGLLNAVHLAGGLSLVRIIGASGAILGLLTVYAWYFPSRTVLLFFIFPVPVRWAVVIIGAISLFLSTGSAGGIAHLTHLGGILVGVLYIRFHKPVERMIDEFRHRRDLRTEAAERHTMREKEEYFREVIDPILEKISRSGMESLTRQEKKHLSRASHRVREKMNREKSVPFDLFRLLK